MSSSLVRGGHWTLDVLVEGNGTSKNKDCRHEREINGLFPSTWASQLGDPSTHPTTPRPCPTPSAFCPQRARALTAQPPCGGWVELSPPQSRLRRNAALQSGYRTGVGRKQRTPMRVNERLMPLVWHSTWTDSAKGTSSAGSRDCRPSWPASQQPAMGTCILPSPVSVALVYYLPSAMRCKLCSLARIAVAAPRQQNAPIVRCHAGRACLNGDYECL
jgi:hypothetical protein